MLNLKASNPIQIKAPSQPDFDRDVLVPLQAAQKAAAEKAAAEARAQAEAALAAAQAAQAVVVAPVIMAVPAAGNYQALGQQMAAARGWTGSEWVDLNNLIMRESGWNPAAQNPYSNACGIAQNINGCGAYPDPSPAGQIQWGLDYIAGRYGDPINAWGHSQAVGWY